MMPKSSVSGSHSILLSSDGSEDNNHDHHIMLSGDEDLSPNGSNGIVLGGGFARTGSCGSVFKLGDDGDD